MGLHHYVADSGEEELPSSAPIGSDCVCPDGTVRVFFGVETGWVTLDNGGGGGGGGGAGAVIDDGSTSAEKCWSSSKISAELAGKADSSGAYPGLVAGSADTLTGRAVTSRTFAHESAGGSTSIGNGAATVRSLRGNTVYFRQCYKLSSSATGYNNNGVTIVKNNNGSFTVSTDSGGATANVYFTAGAFPGVVGHKVLLRGCPLGGGDSSYKFGSADYGYGSIVEVSSGGPNGVDIVVKSGCILASPITFFPQAYDLTEIFGAGNEPTIEEFNAMFPEHFYSQTNNATPLHFYGASYTAFGFNAWDGTKAFVVKSFDGVGQNHGYELHGSYTSVSFGYTADASVSDRIPLTPESYTTEKGDTVTRILTPDKGFVFIEGAAGDTCLHLIWSGNRSGSNYFYEPYAAYSVTLPVSTYFPGGMKKVGGVYDEMNASSAVCRVGSVKLKNMGWVENSTGVYISDYFRTGSGSASSKTIKIPTGDGVPANMKTTFIETTAGSNSVGIRVARTGSAIGRIWLKVESAYESVDALKAAMGDADLIYELANPQTTVFSEPLNLTVSVDDMGIESVEFTGSSAPAVMQTAYALNVQDILARLNMDYISKESFDNFCTALASALNLTITATYNSTTGNYSFTVEETGNA